MQCSHYVRLECVLQCVALYFSVLQCVAVCCSVHSHYIRLELGRYSRCSVLQFVLQCVALYSSVLQCVAVSILIRFD